MRNLLAISLLAASTLAAGPLNGTFGWVPLPSGVSFTGSALGSATSVSVSSTESINTVPALFKGSPNDFLALLVIGSAVQIAPADLTLPVTSINGGFLPDILTAYAAWGTGNRFSFDTSAIEWTTSAPTNLSLIATGTLTDHLGVFAPTPGQVSASFTTTGAGATNVSFTFASQPVAEPPLAGVVGLFAALVFKTSRRKRHLHNI